jgi:hypothetical protein
MNDTQILTWEDDPGQPDAPNQPVNHPVPDIGKAPFPSAIAGAAAEPGGAEGTAEFRYWAAADSVRRAADFWGGICGEEAPWHSTVGTQLTVNLDEGEDFNAYYDRAGLCFFHGEVGGRVFFSGESPDVVCHEFGHAILDSLAPQLWNVHSAEPPALHEAFGDMSAMLSALQLPSLRSEVIGATAGKLDRSSRLSRLAEQLGWAIRQGHPELVESDCLRNASNSFFYKDPLTLPPVGPSSSLSSEPHSLSRVFSGAFLNALAGMFAVQATQDEAGLAQTAQDAGKLLVEAARKTPLCVAYFSQFAAHMLAADEAKFGGKYTESLRSGFIRHGVLALSDATSPPEPNPPAVGMTAGASLPNPPSIQRIALSGQPYGLTEELVVDAAGAPKRFAVASAALDAGSAPEASAEDAAAGYVEDVFRRGHVAIHPEADSGRKTSVDPSHATHEVRREDDSLVLVRRLFYCGLHT